jgi:anti-sigma B factor antagonist
VSEESRPLQVRRMSEKTSVIDVHGSITAASEDALMDAYSRANGPKTRAIVLNFTHLEYLNSSGIGLVVTLLVRANRQRQRLMAWGLNDHYRHIFELTRLNDAISIFDSEADVLAMTETA